MGTIKQFETDEKGWTSLFYAARDGDMEEVRSILKGVRGTGIFPPRQALIELKDAEGLTAIDVAKRAGHKEISDYLDGERIRMEYCE